MNPSPRLLAAAAQAAVLLLAVLAALGQSRLDGPIVLGLTDTHGVHLGDVVPVSVAAVAVLVISALRRSAERADARQDADRADR